ncbi:hypothetical protein C4E24_03095 [ANME-1 cluster archaeon AG-394-G21]|nr:hypothetical protein [ANME-1 cluster archaeon AG-394-G21]
MSMQTRAIAVKKKRKITVLTLLLLVLLFLSPVSAGGVRHQIYSEASSSDEGIYSFFSDVIRDAGICLDMFIDESPDAENFSTSLESTINLTEEESRSYAAKGIESNVSLVVQPFSTLSEGVEKIAVNQKGFLSNITILKNESDYSAYVNARKAVVIMRAGADEINHSLDRIAPIELRNETSMLLFNVTDQRGKIKDVYVLIGNYERLLEKYEFKGLLVDVSDHHPLLSQEITIYVYAGDISSLSLFIDKFCYELKSQTYQTKNHTFETLGEHLIYAKGITGDGEKMASNIVKVYVDKIPTFIVLSSKYSDLLTKHVKITGRLVDYYNNPLPVANVIVKTVEEETVLKTDRRGSFEFNCAKSSGGDLYGSALYSGNNSYKGSGANITISRSPISLHIESDRTEVNVDEIVNITGSVHGMYLFNWDNVPGNDSEMLLKFLKDDLGIKWLENVTISKYNHDTIINITAGEHSAEIIMDERKKNAKLKIDNSRTYVLKVKKEGDELNVYQIVSLNYFVQRTIYLKIKNVETNTTIEETIIADKDFDFPLSFSNPGNYTVQAFFTGDPLFEPADSNIIKIAANETEAGYPFITLIIALIAIASIFAGIYVWKRRVTNQKNKPAEIPEMDIAEEKKKEGLESVPSVPLLESEGVAGAYKLLFDTIVAKYNLKKSFTPRELVEKVKKEPFAERLEKVTELYEKNVYRNVELMDEERETYFKSIKEILGLGG